LIDSGELGQVRYIYSQRLNLGRIRNDVDALWNLAPHDVSIVQYLFGDPKPISVTCHGLDYVQHGINDVAFLNIVYPNRLMVNIHVSWLDPNKQRRMVIVGSDKMAIYDDIKENKIEIWDKGIDRMAKLGENMDYDDVRHFAFSHRSGAVAIPSIPFEEPLKLEIQHFLDCIRTGAECLTGPEHARRVTKILHDASGNTQICEVIAPSSSSPKMEATPSPIESSTR
jgi:predicted dehydrogenase